MKARVYDGILDGKRTCEPFIALNLEEGDDHMSFIWHPTPEELRRLADELEAAKIEPVEVLQ